MGLNNEISNIKREIENKTKKEQSKQDFNFVKMQLMDELVELLVVELNKKNNIYNCNVKDILIDSVCEGLPLNKYNTYLNHNYYTLCNKALNIYNKELKLQEQLKTKPVKKEVVQLKSTRAVQPISNNYNLNLTKDLFDILNVFIKIFTCSVGLGVGFISAISGNKKRRRR